MGKRCPGTGSHLPIHGHGRAAKAQVYPRKLCITCAAIKRQRDDDMKIAQDICSLEDELNAMEKDEVSYWDDAKGGWLDPSLVEEARSKEIDLHTQEKGV